MQIWLYNVYINNESDQLADWRETIYKNVQLKLIDQFKEMSKGEKYFLVQIRQKKEILDNNWESDWHAMVGLGGRRQKFHSR